MNTSSHSKARDYLETAIKAELGSLCQENCNTALRNYRLSAALGNHQAQFFLAVHYACGFDGHHNPRLAIAWFRRAAMGGEFLCALVSKRKNPAPDDLIKEFAKLLR